LKNGVFWDVTACVSCKNRHFERTYRLHHQGEKNRQTSNKVSSSWQPKHAGKKHYNQYFFAERFGCQLLLTLFLDRRLATLMMEAKRFSEILGLQEPHRVTSNKTAFFIITAVKSSDLTSEGEVWRLKKEMDYHKVEKGEYTNQVAEITFNTVLLLLGYGY
jgi:hypothetical protein